MAFDRFYTTDDVWPTTLYQAHCILERAYMHTLQAQRFEFEIMETRTYLAKAIRQVNDALQAEYQAYQKEASNA